MSNRSINYDVRVLLTAALVEGHTQVIWTGLSELAGEEGGRGCIAHMCDIQESASSRQLDR